MQPAAMVWRDRHQDPGKGKFYCHGCLSDERKAEVDGTLSAYQIAAESVARVPVKGAAP